MNLYNISRENCRMQRLIDSYIWVIFSAVTSMQCWGVFMWWISLFACGYALAEREFEPRQSHFANGSGGLTMIGQWNRQPGHTNCKNSRRRNQLSNLSWLGGGFQIFFDVHPYLGKIPILANIFQNCFETHQLGWHCSFWNEQIVIKLLYVYWKMIKKKLI